MSEQEEPTVTAISTTEVRAYSIHLEDLHRNLNKNSVAVSEVVDILGKLQGLQTILGFSDIGKQAAEWREILLEDYNLEGPMGLLSIQLKDDTQEELQSHVQTWRTRFVDTLETEIVTATSQTNISTQKLLRGPTAFMSLQSFEGYEDELHDLQEASINLVIGTFTSSEFMSLRAVEGVLRKWHNEMIDEEKNYDGWAAAIKEISEADDGKGPKELRLLDYLRERRNEVAHPDRHSDLRDAENTLQQSIDVAETLIREIRSANENI